MFEFQHKHTPSIKNKFTILVIGVIGISIHSINRKAGQESSGPDLIGNDLMIFITKSLDTDEKSREHAGGGSLGGPSGKLTRILFILPLKYVTKESARSLHEL